MKKYLFAVLVIAGVWFAQSANASIDWSTYSESAFDAAIKSDKVVVIGFHKKGCPTCAVQDRKLKKAGLNEIPDLVKLRVERRDDSQSYVYEKYGLKKSEWSAIVLIKGGKEVARLSPGTTDDKQVLKFVNMVKE
jgi:thiol-disulfide isomerase/thioredoxin